MIMRTTARGFTLIEIIATLVLISVLGTVAAMFMGNFLTGYTAVKNNSSAALKAQMALNRISLELKDMSSMQTSPPPSSSSGITYTNLTLDPLGGNRTIKFDGSKNYVYISTATDNVLIDKVSGFTLPSVPCDPDMYGSGASGVAYIDISFSVTDVGNFSTRIFPRSRIACP